MLPMLSPSIYIAGLFGALFGSFFNLLISRLPQSKPIVWNRSECPTCQHTLSPLDLVPILSYIALFGRCRYCKKCISFRYLLCELLTAGYFMFCWHQYGLSLMGIKLILFCSAFIVLFFTDIETYTLPDLITLPLIVIGLVFALVEGTLISSLLGCILGFSVYFSLGWLAKLYYKQEVMGGGDMKLGAAIGAFWGLTTVGIACYMSFLIGGFIGLILLVLQKKSLRDHMPFGPAIILATLVVLFFEPQLWTIYRRLMSLPSFLE